MQEDHSIAQLCDALAVSRSGYHAWAAREPGPRAQASAALRPHIEEACRESRQTYGAPRVWQWLLRHGHSCGRHRVARLMRGHSLRSQIRRRFRVHLTDSKHDLPIAPNRLRDLHVQRRDAVWVADITYVPTDEGWLYVAGILDWHTRRCVGWAMVRASGAASNVTWCIGHTSRPGASARRRPATKSHGFEGDLKCGARGATRPTIYLRRLITGFPLSPSSAALAELNSGPRSLLAAFVFQPFRFSASQRFPLLLRYRPTNAPTEALIHAKMASRNDRSDAHALALYRRVRRRFRYQSPRRWTAEGYGVGRGGGFVSRHRLMGCGRRSQAASPAML